MKIFYIPSGAGFFHEPIDQAIIHTLRELNVETYPYNLVHIPDLDYLKLLEDIRPDLILTLYGTILNRNIMKNIKQTGYKTALWLVDDPYELDTTLTFAHNFDFVFTIEKNCIPFYQKAGVKNVYWLPLATWPTRFKPLDVLDRYRSDICLVGTAFNNRLALVDQLADYFLTKETKIIGRWWEKLKNYQKLQQIIQNQLTEPEEIVHYYNGAKINININRIFNIANSRNIPAENPNNRTFDIAACHAFQLTDYRKLLSHFYIPEREIVIFNSAADLRNKIEYYLNQSRKREEIARSARLKTINEHTFHQRLSQLIQIIGNK